MNRNSTGVIILTAGASGRMKIPKAFLPYGDGQTFIGKIMSTYCSWGCVELIIVANNEVSDRLKESDLTSVEATLVTNHHPENERFYSVKLGLGQLVKSQYCFIQNVDNPFITSEILDIIHKGRAPDAYLSPVFNGQGGHPILLSRNIIRFIRDHPADDANLKQVLQDYPCKRIPVNDERVLININSPTDYRKYFDVPFNQK
ncbi:MAG: NTP transferase domain-containing protein [Bacteroidetes bacterium]|nr:NTP transferase domain-containing protein [Bacteroidota bacterium]